MKNKAVYITGCGMTKFGELWEQDLRDIGVSALLEALDEAKIKPNKLDAIFIANMTGSTFSGQQHLGALFCSELGINIPAFHIEAACASGGVAINNAFNTLQGGSYSTVAVLGVEKMSDLDSADVTKGLTPASDEEWEAYYGVTFPSLYAMLARSYMEAYQITREDLGLVAIKNHKHAALNPLAQFPNEISTQDILKAQMIASPLSIMDSAPITDGAAAVILSTKKSSVPKIIASQIATDTLALHDRESLTELKSAQIASKAAFAQANLSIDNIDIAEVHDCFTIAELLAYEDLGLAQKGKARELIESGQTELNGRIPINTSGGLKACGHPIGATGVKQIVEITRQMQGKCEARQVKKTIKYGLTHNIGGSGATAVINIIQNA